MVQKTSIETFHKIKQEGLLSDKRMKVYEILYEHPNGLTGTQVSDIFKSRYPSSKTSETIRNRITELKYMGVVTEVGIVICESTNNHVAKFCTTDNVPEKFIQKPTLNQQIDAVLKNMEIFASRLSGVDKDEFRIIYKQLRKIKK